MKRMNKISLESWFNDIKPTLRKRQQEVLHQIVKFGKTTQRDCASRMNVGQHVISGRFTELTDKGLIHVVETIKGVGGVYDLTNNKNK